MPAAEPTPPPLPSQHKKWQFSLRTLMIGMTGFAIFFALVVLLPKSLSLLLTGAIWLASAGWLLIGLLFARGEQQAFCIGASLVYTSMWTQLGGRFMAGLHDTINAIGADVPNAAMQWVDLLWLGLAAIANGYLCICARRYFERHSEEA